METKLFEQLKELGFSNELIGSAALYLPTAGKRFTVSERKRIGDCEVKFVALLYYNAEKSTLALRWYHAADVSGAAIFGSGGLADPRIAKLDRELAKMNFSDRSFIRSEAAAPYRDRNQLRKANELYESLNTLDDREIGIIRAKKMLKVKYFHDTIYGTRKLLIDGTARKYEEHFNTLTIQKATGIIKLNDAARLLLDKQLTNRSSPAEITTAIRELQSLPRRRRQATCQITSVKKENRKKH
jgi:hypothetical protein